jgi:predicted phage baseplate assembly protein
MNVAADTLTAFIDAKPDWIDAITNPLPAEGGRDPEPDESIRFKAPEAFRTDACRAVRLEDFNEIVQRDLSWVQRSGSVIRWTGSWPTVFVTPDPHEEIGLSPLHRRDLERLTDRVRQAAREVKVLDPQYANLNLEIHICVAPNAYAGEVEAAVLTALFGDRETIGFFDPDNFTFGMPLSRAALMSTIQEVPGVRAVGNMYVSRRGYFDKRLFSEFTLPLRMNEVVQVANNRLLPERGAVTLVMEGGA